MVRYAIVRYTREEVCFADGKEMAQVIAQVYANKDYDSIESWYTIEPDHVY